ncbi:hypothetical protein CCP4SC76_810002 [Gammaproteobacteria bacterium]
MPIHPGQTSLRRSEPQTAMMDALVEARAELGKETVEHHFWCESKLCNGVVTGKFAKIDEKTLSNEDVALLERVRDRNRAFLLTGLDYPTRKARLIAYATRERTKRLTAMPPMALPVATARACCDQRGL